MYLPSIIYITSEATDTRSTGAPGSRQYSAAGMKNRAKVSLASSTPDDPLRDERALGEAAVMIPPNDSSSGCDNGATIIRGQNQSVRSIQKIKK
jgi:hypothetical protein